MKFLTREDVVKKQELRFKDIEVFGGKMRVRELIQDELSTIGIEAAKKGEKENDENVRQFKIRLVCLGAVDETMNQLFKFPDDLKMLSMKPAVDITRISDTVMSLSGMSKETAEEAVKN